MTLAVYFDVSLAFATLFILWFAAFVISKM